MRKKILVYAIIGIIFSYSAVGCVKIVKVGEEDTLIAADVSNKSINIEEAWEGEILSELKSKAIDINVLLNEASGDISSLGEEYGIYSSGESGSLNFVVSGVGEILSINQESKAGYIELKLDEYSGNKLIKIQVGPVFKGTSVRDSSSIVTFDSYSNQVDYAQASTAMNNIISETVISKLNISSLQGQKIEFVGCFTLDKNDEILITPIEINEK